jgi:glycosyltransferase involved in cell wall biosynthesis
MQVQNLMGVHSDRSLRVCYFGTYDEDYPRNRIMIDGLRANGVEVFVCNIPLWDNTEEKVEKASGAWFSWRFLKKLVRVYLQLFRKELALPKYDVMLVGYPGQFDIYLARLLSWRRRIPLVFNALMSLYLIVLERQLDRQSPFTSRLIFWVEKGACLLSDLIILDTTAYVDYFCETYGLSPDKFRLVPLGADNRVYFPTPEGECSQGLFKVVYHGTYIPLHGVEHIIEATNLLRDYSDIHFVMIGRGQLKDEAEATAKMLKLTNITFIDWVEKQELLNHVADAQVCLGVFGTTPQSLYTVQNKIWEGLAMAKPVITGDAPMVREVLAPGQHLLVCERANPEALAEAILRLYHDPDLQQRLAQNGYRIIQEKYTVRETGRRTKAHLLRVLAKA